MLALVPADAHAGKEKGVIELRTCGAVMTHDTDVLAVVLTSSQPEEGSPRGKAPKSRECVPPPATRRPVATRRTQPSRAPRAARAQSIFLRAARVAPRGSYLFRAESEDSVMEWVNAINHALAEIMARPNDSVVVFAARTLACAYLAAAARRAWQRHVKQCKVTLSRL